jgi:hypothetical protein
MDTWALYSSRMKYSTVCMSYVESVSKEIWNFSFSILFKKAAYKWIVHSVKMHHLSICRIPRFLIGLHMKALHNAGERMMKNSPPSPLLPYLNPYDGWLVPNQPDPPLSRADGYQGMYAQQTSWSRYLVLRSHCRLCLHCTSFILSSPSYSMIFPICYVSLTFHPVVLLVESLVLRSPILKGAQVWKFSTHGFFLFLHHKASMGRRL